MVGSRLNLNCAYEKTVSLSKRAISLACFEFSDARGEVSLKPVLAINFILIYFLKFYQFASNGSDLLQYNK